MPTGRAKKATLVFQRTQNNKDLAVWKVGPFLEVEIDGITIGKVKGTSPAYVPAGIDIADECLRLPNYTVLLSDEELVEVSMVLEA